MRTIRNLHRYSAIPIAIFAVVHLTNHLASLLSISSHLAFMQAARLIYRQPVVEAVLLLAVALQIGSGVSIIVQRWRQHRCLASLQVWSGACLAFFLCAHVGAVLFGRSILKLDTNFYFAAAGFHVAPYQYVFAPYYFLGVLDFCRA